MGQLENTNEQAEEMEERYVAARNNSDGMSHVGGWCCEQARGDEPGGGRKRYHEQ
jgi:hypothetical protein